MRTFIALPIPEELKDAILELTSELRSAGADVKWVERENLHITLRFLGEVEEGLIPPLKESLNIFGAFPSFILETKEIGAFPSLNSPRVIWLGISRGKKEMEEMAKVLNARLKVLGFPPEDRPFQAHLTLGRVRSSRNSSALVQMLKNHLELRLTSNIDQIILYKSVLSSSGPRYEELAKIFLRPLKT